MKKVGLIVLILMASLSAAFAPKIAVLDFKAGVGITQIDVDGLSSTFVTYFNPRGYQLVERSQINQVIEEQGFQKTTLTESQMVRLGQIMNLSKIVVGDVNIVGGSPNLDVRVIDVQSGEVTGRDGATFAWTNYRTTMQQLAQKVAGQIGVVYGGAGSNGNVQSTGKSPSGKVETILGYLQVYPEDLGSFNGCPNTVIAAINRQKLNDFSDWRLPTNEELSLLATSKEKLGMGSISSYMSKENANLGGMKIVRLVRSGDNNGVNYGTIRLQPQVGKKYIVTSKSTVVTDMKIQGEWVRHSQTVETRQAFTAKTSTDEQVMLETQIEAVSGSVSQGGSTLRYDTEVPEITSPMMAQQVNEMKEKMAFSYLFSYNKQGRLEYSSSEMPMNGLDGVILQFPEEELKVGSRWSCDKTQDFDDTKININMTYIVTSISESVIDLNFTGTAVGSASGNYHGTASINPQTGLIINSTTSSDIHTTITSQGLVFPVTMTGNTTVSVK